MAYTKYSLTPANNTAAPPDGAPEGMLPSAVNDTMRDMMAQIRDAGDGIRDGTYTMTAPKITGGTITGSTINNSAIGGTTAAAGKFTTLEATGVTTVQAGTVSAPAITTTGDTNTGIFFPAADTIAFSEGGAEAMRLTSAGDVGIGTTSPVLKFVVSNAGANGFEVSPTGTNGGTNLQSYDRSASWTTFNYYSADHRFYSTGAEAMRIDTSGNLQFNSGFGSVATAYGCRAWVNFDGGTADNLTGTYSQTGTTVTVTITAHGYITGNSAYLDFTSGTAVDGAYTVTVTDANTFTVTQASRTTSGNVTDRRVTLRNSGNVSSIADNATGDYTINFITAMPDANYALTGNILSTSLTQNGMLKIHTLATSSARVLTITSNTTTVAGGDFTTISVAIFR